MKLNGTVSMVYLDCTTLNPFLLFYYNYSGVLSASLKKKVHFVHLAAEWWRQREVLR